MKKVIEMNDNLISLVQAHCFLEEYYFINQNYDISKKHLNWIVKQQDELYHKYDDLLYDGWGCGVVKE